VKRAAAVVVALALILGAMAFRRAREDDGRPSAAPGGRASQIVCAEELRDACDSLGVVVKIEDASRTAAALSGSGAPAIDIWMVADPWPGIVDDARVRAGLEPLFDDASIERVGRSRLGVLGLEGLADCDWRCIGDRAGAGDLRVGSRAATSGVGVLHIGALAAGWFDKPDFAANDFDGAFTSWITAAADALSVDEDPATRLLQSRAFFDAALSFEAEAAPALDAASDDRSAGLALLYPAPVTYLDALVVDVGGTANELADRVAAALLERGWSAPDDTPTGLPRPGVMIALGGLL
jgi:hypothetical protein